MSIVERAIKKLQDAGAEPPASRRAASVAQPDDAVEHPAAIEPGLPPPPKPTRIVPFDLARLRSHRLMPAPSDERELAGQYRQMKRPLVARALGRGLERVPRGNALVITSALPAEGKTFTAINLALSIALEQDIEVLLVDADVAKPRLTGEFGLGNERGLLDALADDDVDVESLVVGTDIPSLLLLPAGTPSSTATELLASPRMETVLEQLCELHPNRIVIFDSSPLLPTTEGRALVAWMGQVVVAVRAGSTPQQAVFEALRLIGERDNVNLVLTQAEGGGAGAYYYSNYGYGEYGTQQAEGGGPPT